MIMNKRIRPLHSALLLTALGLGGCGSPPSPAATSGIGLAKTTLTRVLDSWKNGEASDALSKASPVVYVAEEEWKGGAKLESYSIENEQMVGTSLHCPVSLKLKDVGGKSVTRKVTYIVMTTPVLRVDRQE